MVMIDEQDRERANAFAVVADDYDRARPSYPLEAVRWLIGRTRLDVVDLGAGTGKLTEVLQGDQHRVVAVEPSPALRDKLAARLPTTTVLAGRAEGIPLPDRSADAVLVAQAFHWFDRAAALEEIARVLRPGGTLGLIWNFRDLGQAWVRDLVAMLDDDGLDGGWEDDLEALDRVRTVQHRDFRQRCPIDRHTLAALVTSYSTVAKLTPPRRQRVLDEVGALWDNHPELGDTSDAHLEYRTEAYRVQLNARIDSDLR
jgi:SAM-dependent methyltransferase